MTCIGLETHSSRTKDHATYNADAHEERLRRHQSPSTLGIAEFALVHRNSARLDAGANACNVSSDHNLRDRVRCALQNGADDL